MKRRALTVGLLAGLTFTTSAFADCAAPPPVVWSYPHDGATDVPTDADFLVIGTASSVEIDGRVIERSPTDYAVDLGEFEPNTEYTLQIGEGPGSGVDPEPITFTTSSGPGVIDLPRLDDATCEAIYNWQGCFDTGPPDVVEIEVDYPGEEPLYVLYAEGEESLRPVTLWPRQCGETIRYQTIAEGAEYEVKALGYNGMLHEADSMIPEEDEKAGGCSVNSVGRGPHSGGWLLVFGLVASLLARGRRCISPPPRPYP